LEALVNETIYQFNYNSIDFYFLSVILLYPHI